MQFSPEREKDCSGHIYGDDMTRLFRSLDSIEEFQFSPGASRVRKPHLRYSRLLKESEVEGVLRTKLTWLIQTTWPEIQKLLEAHRA